MTVHRPLQGLRVLDTTEGWGELCGRLLAELGAQVVRIEAPGGSASRRRPPLHDGIGLFHAYRNQGKEIVEVDLHSSAGGQRADGLLAGADAWLDSSLVGPQGATAFEPAAASGRHRHLVVTSITPFGRTGPYAEWRATDSVVDAMSGMMFKAGVPEKPPLLPPSAISNDTASVTAAFATLAAYWQKLSTGHGQLIDLSIMEAAAQTTDWSLPNAAVMRSAGLPYAQVRAGAGIYGIHPCRDGWIRIVIMSPRQWRAMRAWLGEPDYLQDPSYETLRARIEINELLAALYAELFSTMSMEDAAADAQRRGIAATPLLRPDEVLANQHLTARQLFGSAPIAPERSAPLHGGFFFVDGERLRPPTPVAGTEFAAQPDPTDDDPAPTRPLTGLRVLDFGVGGVGVEAGRFFAENGADVIKVETRSYPDFMRQILGNDMNPSFASSNRSKRALGVNAKHPEGLDLLRRLIPATDVIIENTSTGTMAGLGLDYESVHRINRRTVMASSQLMGSFGPWAKWIGYGPSTQPVSGLSVVWDYDDDDAPAGSMSIMPDHLAGRVLALGALAGLVGRHRTGDGCHLEVAQVEVAAAMIGDQLLKAALEPGSVGAGGNRRPDGAPWGAYPCAGEQEWCVITVGDDQEWHRLVDALGNPEWAQVPELSVVAGRRQAHDDIDAHLTVWTSTRTKEEAAATLQRAGVAAAPMLTGSDQLDDPHLLAHGYPVEIVQQVVGPITLEGPCFRATGMLAPVATEAPMPGQHTREIGRQLLGLSDPEIDALVESGALEAWAG